MNPISVNGEEADDGSRIAHYSEDGKSSCVVSLPLIYEISSADAGQQQQQQQRKSLVFENRQTDVVCLTKIRL